MGKSNILEVIVLAGAMYAVSAVIHHYMITQLVISQLTEDAINTSIVIA